VYLNIPPHLTLTPLEVSQEISLWSLLEKKGIRLTHTEQTIQAVPATDMQASLLEVSAGFPLLLVEGVAYADGHQPVEFHQIFNRGDRYKYTVYAER
jgi:GntR family transcriptional regulator